MIAQPFDPAAGKFTGEPQTLSESVLNDTGLWDVNVSVSNTSVLVYASGTAAGSQVLTWYDRDGKALTPMLRSRRTTRGSFSAPNSRPVSRWAAERSAGRYGHLTAVRSRTPPIKVSRSRSPTLPVTPPRTLCFRRLIANSRQSRIGLATDATWYEQGTGLDLRLWVLPVFGDRKPFPYAESLGRTLGGSLSPDRRWMLYSALDGPSPAAFVAPFPWTGVRWQVSDNQAGVYPRWRSDGKEIYYFDYSQIVAVEVDGSGPTFHVGSSKPLFRIPVRGINREYAPTRDGKRFIAIALSESSSQSLTVVQNWPAELKAR